MEKQKFEQEWKNAFDQAEVSPSDNLWTNIELNLEKADATRMKSRLLFYKLMAAASIFFAVCMAGAFAYYYNTLTTNDNGQFVADNAQHQKGLDKSNTITRRPEQSKAIIASSGQPSAVSKNQTITSTTATDKTPENGVTNKATREISSDNQNLTNHRAGVVRHRNEVAQNAQDDPTRAVVRDDADIETMQNNNNRNEVVGNADVVVRSIPIGNQNEKNIAPHNNDIDKSVVTNINNDNGSEEAVGRTSVEEAEVPIQLTLHARNLPSLTSTRAITIQWPEQDPVARMMARLAKRERELSGDDQKKIKPKSAAKEERLWTSLGMAAGAFNNITQTTSGVNNNNTFASSNVTSNQSKASGSTYSVGMNVGTRLSSRWVLQGGVNYLAQNSSYQANSVVGSADNSNLQAASINSFSPRNSVQSNKLVATVPYSVDNSVRFVSVPVQAGYMVINRAVGVQLNGGLSTDLFLQNTLTPQSSSLPTITQGSGENSPYRTVNFSGLVGTELSYRFSRRYRLALNPGLRYPLNSIYKSDVGIKSSPLTFDVGLRFRYIFR